MKSNTSPQFVGLDELKRKHKAQLADFEQWAASGNWNAFHLHHYDWWMFPYDKSSAYGKAYTVYEAEVSELKKEDEFINNYLRGVELLLLSWGWDLKRRCLVKNPGTHQCWADWPIRIHKCGSSLLLFGFDDVFQSVKMYAKHLINERAYFGYDGKDRSELFL
ncbi:MAG: hypothetical protein LBT83_04230 [Tannerella sp.]|jgi:hypothetical protein|nr:hypothetical protein [Tannerella sp.]